MKGREYYHTVATMKLGMAVVSGYYISILTVVVVMVVVVVTEVVVVVVGLGKASWCRTGRVRIISRGVRTLIC